MFKKKSCLIGLLCITTAAVAADYNPFYIQTSAGASFSMQAKVSNIDFTIWDPANEGYDTRIGNTPTFGLGLGYNVNPWASLLASWDWRGIYNYKKNQTQVIGSNPIDPLGAKTRYFDIKNSNLMLTFIANCSQLNNMHFDFNNGAILTPFIGVGLGIAKNDLSNFYSITPDAPNLHRNYLNSQTTYSLAAQGITGLSLLLNKQIGVDLGYKFYYGGRCNTNTMIIDPIDDPLATPPWKTNLLTNEIFVSLKYNF